MAGRPTYENLQKRIEALEQEKSVLLHSEVGLKEKITELTHPDGPYNNENIGFEDLFNVDDIQKLQDDFANATGVASIITAIDGTPLTVPSNLCRLCTDIFSKTSTALPKCFNSELLVDQLSQEGPVLRGCMGGGLWNATATITVGGVHIAHWLIGKVRKTSQTEEKVVEYARAIGACKDDVVVAFREIPVMSREDFDKVGQLLFTIATQLSSAVFQKVEQKRFISERTKAEDLLREGEKEYRATLDNLVVGVVVHASDSSILYNNPAATILLGFTSDQMLGREIVDPIWNFIHEDLSVVEVEDYPVSKVLSTQQPIFDSVYGIQSSDHKIITWVIVNAIPVFSACGDVEKVIVNFLDYTERKQAGALLRQKEALLNTTQQLAKIGGWEVDLVTKQMFWTDEIYRIHDLDRHTFKDIPNLRDENNPDEHGVVDKALKLSLQCYNSEYRSMVIDAYRRCEEKGEPYDLQVPFKTIKGREMWVRTIADPVIENGHVKKIVGYLIDITAQKRAEDERKKLESQLQQAVKLEALGILAGGIAHDFNNILAAILGYSQMALDELSPSSDIYHDINQILISGNRAADLVQQILLFSRREVESFHPIRIQDTIHEVVGMFSSTLPSSINFSDSIDVDCGSIHADSTQIHQVIMNLCTNARQAIQDDYGLISLSLSEVVPPSSLFSLYGVEKIFEKYACLEIRDSGCGIPTEDQSKIFDPFFTTKIQEQGTGLGLSVVNGIIRKHHGFITLESHLGTGTVFQVFLPIVETTSDFVIAVENHATAGSERILLVDDEDVLIDMNKRYLERFGYKVTGFSDSLKALTYFQQNSDAFDIVVTDMTMPNLTGLDLIREIMQIKSNIKTVLCSGYSSAVTEEKTRAYGINGFLTKPFLPKVLTEIIRKVFDHG